MTKRALSKDRVEEIQRLAKQPNMNVNRIAVQTGVAHHTVRVYMNKSRRVSIVLPIDVFETVEAEANKRAISVGGLIERMIKGVASRQSFDRVLNRRG